MEEIEGKSPIVKIKTCFKWKGTDTSGILRMEVTLFSGFELGSMPPLLLNPQVNMTEMLHGFHDNNLWFVFANVSSDCPVCVQYSIRSAFIISSIRPAYARIYPVSREDLAADTFFHTPIGSSLLKDITEDDLFTWFRHNSTNVGNVSLKNADKCSLSIPTIVTEVSAHQVNTNTPNPTVTADVVTYTINVDSETTKNLSKPDEFPTTIQSTMASQKHELHRVQVVATNKLVPTKKPLKKVKQITEVFTTPKHVNTKKQDDIPVKYLPVDTNENETPATFAPEIKNDKYVLLDKEQLWGMLREVVNDEINKKIKLS